MTKGLTHKPSPYRWHIGLTGTGLSCETQAFPLSKNPGCICQSYSKQHRMQGLTD